jgi:NHLM bacteriocin system ABC transporter peptidase/ATP-binding protein
MKLFSQSEEKTLRISKRLRPRRVRTATVLQMESAECGAASLSMILQYHGRVVTLEKLREACGVSRNGSKASNILKAARDFGLASKGLRKELADLPTLRAPFIIFWNFNHFLVYEGCVRDKVYLNDPRCGPRIVTLEELNESFTGVVLTFEKTPAFAPGGERQKLFHLLGQRLSSLKAPFAYLLLATLGLTIPSVVLPILYRVYVDDIIVRGLAAWLLPLLLVMGVVCLIKVFITLIQQHCLLRVEAKLALSSSSKFFWHILRLPIEFFAQRWPSEIGSRVEINYGVSSLIAGDLATNLVNIMLLGVYICLMVQYDAMLATIVAGIAVLNLVTLRWVSRKRKDFNRKLQQEQGKLTATTMAGLQMIETLKATGGESDFFARWAGYHAKVLNVEQDLGTTSQLLAAVPPFLAALNLTAVLGFGGLRVMDGFLTMGMLLAFQSLAVTFSEPVGKLVDLGGKLPEAEAYLTRLDDVLRYPPEIATNQTEAGKAPAIHIPRLEGHLEVRNVTFGYSRLDPPLIKDFSLQVKPGQRVALVGSSGSGKSTISKIVCGLYKPWSGEVLFDGKRREEIPREVLTNSIAMVDQDIFLFKGTVRDNITMWDSTLPESVLNQAAKDAQIHDDITHRPTNYDFLLNEGGSNFSGGQRQRLEIARALAANPRILVLDEATSALDARVEELIADCVRRRGCTCLIVAHRLSTIRDCDEIVVLDTGIVVQRDTHRELMKVDGPYSRLIHAQ